MISRQALQAQLEDRWDEHPVWRGIGCYEGWDDLLSRLDTDLRKIYPEYTILQIKEKFGLLRFYIGGVPKDYSSAIHERIHHAEIESAVICEMCGNPGVLRGGGWVQTLCDEHAEGRPPLEYNE